MTLVLYDNGDNDDDDDDDGGMITWLRLVKWVILFLKRQLFGRLF